MSEDLNRLKRREWTPEAFVPQGAIRFGGQANAFPPPVIPDAWDHEHCLVCWESINPRSDTHWWGYHNALEGWLCVECYRKHISRQCDPPPSRPRLPGVPHRKPRVRPWKQVERKGRRPR